MPFDFSLPPRVEQWRDRITRFVDDVVIPGEQDGGARSCEVHRMSIAKRAVRRARAHAGHGD
jgi:hypothetical protein